MKKLILVLSAFTLFATFLTSNLNAGTQVYDLKADWSDTENPNGPWSYHGPGPGGLLVNDPVPWIGSANGVNVIGRATQSLVEFLGWPLAPGYLEPGDILVMGGDGVSIRWTAPATGTVTVSGNAWSAVPEEFGSKYAWILTKNAIALSSGNNGDSREFPSDFSTGSGGGAALTSIEVVAGDSVEVALQLIWGSGIGLNLTITLETASVNPVAAIENLALAVFEMNLQNGIENQLDSKLDAALGALNDANVQNDGAACNSLQAFISAVEAQRGNKITGAQADELVSSAQGILTLLDRQN